MIKVRGAKKIYWCDFRTIDGQRVRQSLHTTDRKEARELEAKLMTDSEERAKKRSGGITMEQAYNHALRSRDDWRSAKSPESITKVYGYVSKHFGATRTLSSLDEDTLVTYGADLIKAGLAASTINKRLSLINVLFEEAIASGKYQGKAPRVEHYKVQNGRMRLITQDEEVQALSLLRENGTEFTLAMADLVLVLADTGARLSEALGIVPSRVYRNDKAVLLVNTKNGDNRIVPLTTRTLEVLVRRNSNPMFGPLNVNNVEHIWARVRKQMGLEHDKEFVLHAFRHTYGSTLANAGVDAFRIQKVMGHKSIQTTEGYVKVATSALTGLAEVMQNRYAQNHTQMRSESGNN